jgi:hypothetical protein
MNDWNRMLVQLDKTIGFPNKIRSSVKKRWQGYDLWKNEHVIMLEYRIKVNPGIHPPAKPPLNPRDIHRDPSAAPMRQTVEMPMIRELMDVRFVNTVDSSPSPRSNGSGKKTTSKKPPVPKKTRPNLPASPIKPV